MRSIVKIIILSLVLFGLYALDFVHLGLSETVRTAPGLLLLMAVLDTAVLSAVVMRSKWHGWRLAAAVFLAFYALKTFLVGIEAVYLSDIMTPDLTRTLFLNGLIVALLFSPLVVWGNGRWSPPAPSLQTTASSWRWWTWGWRLALAAVGYVVLFIAGGLLVFTPVARALDPAAHEAYAGSFSPPDWLLLFILARGLLWVLLCLPLLRSLNGRLRQIGLLTALLFGVLMGSNLLLPAGLPPTMQLAHLVEVFVENALFGLWAAWLLAPRPALGEQPHSAVISQPS